MSKVLNQIESIRINRERRRLEIEAARADRAAAEAAEEAVVAQAAAFLNGKAGSDRKIRGKSAPRIGNAAPNGPRIPRFGLEYRRMIDDFRSSVEFGGGLSTVSADESGLNSTLENGNSSFSLRPSPKAGPRTPKSAVRSACPNLFPPISCD